MIAGEQRILFSKREAEMIGGVAGRGDRLEGEASSINARAVAKRLVGRVVERVRGVGARRLAVGDHMGGAPTISAPVAAATAPRRRRGRNGYG